MEYLSNKLSINFKESSFDLSLFNSLFIFSDLTSGINLFIAFINFLISKISFIFFNNFWNNEPSVLNIFLLKYILFNKFILSWQNLSPFSNSKILKNDSFVPSL